MSASFDFAPLALRYAQDERWWREQWLVPSPFVLNVAEPSRRTRIQWRGTRRRVG